MLPGKEMLLEIKNEQGAALLIVILMLLLLTLMGTFALTTTNIEIKISGNEKDYLQEFYVSDSGWKEMLSWLNNKAAPPPNINLSLDPNDNVIKNFGDGGDGVLNDTFPEGTEDGRLSGIPYWNKVEYESDTIVPGSGKDFRKFNYTTISNADGRQEIEVKLSKIYKAGY